MLTNLFKFVLDLCLLRTTPAAAPAQPAALGLAMLLFLGLATLGYSMQDNSHPPLLPALQNLLLISAIVSGLLQALQLQSRIRQTLFSLFMAGTLLGCAGLLLQLGIPADRDAGINPIIVIAWLALFGWSFVVDAHIYRHALQRNFTIGLMLAVVVFTIDRLLLAAWYLPAL